MADVAGVNGQREHFRVVGKPNLPGKLSYALATGIAKFGIDYVVPEMLHAKFLRSPYGHAKVVRVDTANAWAVPGVVDIITWEDDDIIKLSTGGFGPPKPWIDNIADEEGAEVAVIVVVCCIGAVIFAGSGFLLGRLSRSRLDGLDGAVLMTYVNNVLIVVFAARFFGPTEPLMAAAYMLPLNVMLLPIRFATQREAKISRGQAGSQSTK